VSARIAAIISADDSEARLPSTIRLGGWAQTDFEGGCDPIDRGARRKDSGSDDACPHQIEDQSDDIEPLHGLALLPDHVAPPT
jgi:hypothetical protein